MSIVAWDGKCLAVDRAGTDGQIKWATTKVWEFQSPTGTPVYMTGVGSASAITTMREWYKAGLLPDRFPVLQTGKFFCNFITVDFLHGLRRYEQSPYPMEHGFEPCAFGSAREIAIGAMAMGATADQAVEICNKFSNHCGLGVSVYEIREV